MANIKADTMTCPQCGAFINSFTGKCPSCGTEFFGLKASDSIIQFSEKMSGLSSPQQKIDLIKTFPIPNTKEDIMEYMLLASSNIGYVAKDNPIDKEYENAWVTKFMQGYQKAKLVFSEDYDFNKIQQLYENTLSRLDNAEKQNNLQFIFTLAVKNIGVTTGIVTAIIAVIMNIFGANSSLLELLAVILFIMSACTLGKRKAEYTDYLIGIASGALLIAFAFLLDNGAAFDLGGAAVLIIVTYNFFHNLNKN
jgi:hypothetical protein